MPITPISTVATVPVSRTGSFNVPRRTMPAYTNITPNIAVYASIFSTVELPPRRIHRLFAGRQEPADPRLEDHLALDDDELLVEEQLHRLAQHVRLEVEPLALHLVERVVTDVDVEHVLHDDRPLVELLGHEVGRAPVHPHAALVCLL